MGNFKVGQQVVCIKRGQWRSNKFPGDAKGPKFNELVTVSGIKNDEYIYLLEYPNNGLGSHRSAWFANWFEPLVTDLELEEALIELQYTETL